MKDSIPATKLYYFTAIRVLSKYILKHRKNFLMFYFGWLLDTVLSVAMPLLFGIMIDEIVYYQNVDTFVRIALFFVTLSVFSCVLYFMIYAQHHYLMNMYTLDIKKDLFDHFQKADAEFLSDASTGDIISILTSYSDECMHFVIRNIIHFLNGLIKIAAISIYLFVIDWKIGLAALLVTPISVIVNSKYGKKIRGYSDKQREYYKGYVSWVFEIFTALRDIRMLGAQRKVQSTFEDNHKRMFDINVKSSISSLTANNIIMFTKLIIQLGMFTLAGFAAMSGNITVGLLIVIVAFYEDLTSNTYHLSRTWLDAQDRISYIQRIHDFMETPTEDVWAGKNTLDVSDGKVTFNNIGFAYKKSSEVLNGFSLDIPSGERFALVGKSGCGKTTIAYMMIGFYRPRHGFIEIDGHKLSDCTLKSIRQNIGLIQQDVLVFDGTIKENILLGNRNASDEQVRNVCVQAGLWDFITTLSNGLDTVIGTKGVGLSGGQKQRVAIARIYLKDPKIIIFDEATSSLDSETEENIHAAWKGVLSGRTAIVIAHRLSSVMLCDRVAIIDGGQVSAIGNPQEMQRNNHAFKTLFAIKEAENHVRQD